MGMSGFPSERLRRLRGSGALRRAFAETSLAPSDLIAPMFLKEGIAEPAAIASMPNQFQHTIESLVKEARSLASKGVAGVILFGVPSHKDEVGSEAWNSDGITQRGIRALKDELGDEALVIADLCLCEYTDHGHCGILKGEAVDNDPTIEAYGRIAVSLAEAGADLIAPSGMMDGQVGAIRAALDSAGHEMAPIPRTPPSSPRSSTVRSATRPRARRASATVVLIRPIPPTSKRRCAKRSPISKREPMPSW